MEQIKPGIKTTEFWLAVVSKLIGVAAMLGYLTPEQAGDLTRATTEIVGGAMIIVPYLAYALSRARSKAGAR